MEKRLKRTSTTPNPAVDAQERSARNFKKDCRRAVFTRIAQCVALILAIALIAVTMIGLAGCATQVTATDKANGMPLDACSVTEYECPVWLEGCSHAYKVVDRQTGDTWWLLVMHENTKEQDYIVLPCEDEK